MNVDSPLYLALDQGGHSSRAFVFDSSGDIIARAQVPITTQVSRVSLNNENQTQHTSVSSTSALANAPDNKTAPADSKADTQKRIEHSAAELAASLRTCCQQIGYALGDKCAHITQAGLATQRSSIVCWRRSTGTAITPVLSWQDRRAADYIDARFDNSDLVEDLTGLVMSPHYGASKLRWCLDNEHNVREAAKACDLTIGPLASFLARTLTGATHDVCDPANASRTLLWNRHTKVWSTRLCELFGIDQTLLPESVPTRYDFGRIRVGAYSIPLRLVTGDQSAAIYAFGQASPSTAFINLGTGAFMQCPIGQKTADVDGLLNSVVYQDETRIEHVLEGTVNGAGRALTWWSERHNRDVRTLVKEALDLLQTKTEFARNVPVFLNGISGLGSPYWRSHFKSRFVAGPGNEGVQPRPHAGAIAILESIAFLLNANLVRAAVHVPLNQLILTGGLASVDYLCRSLADISGITTVRSTLREATAHGTGYLLAQSDHWQDTGQLTTFDVRNNENLLARHKTWQTLMAGALGSTDT
ncbi:MAG: FGGY family carbohydrate kinase [Gammaproteobacteria bacterium]